MAIFQLNRFMAHERHQPIRKGRIQCERTKQSKWSEYVDSNRQVSDEIATVPTSAVENVRVLTFTQESYTLKFRVSTIKGVKAQHVGNTHIFM